MTAQDCPVISFCVTCRNRLWQLRQTLGMNLAALTGSHNIVLIDYASSDGLSSWIWTNFEKDLRHGRLTFFEVMNQVNWSVSKAKNLAHRLAAGSYLFNLDADNKISDTDIRHIEHAASLGVSCHQFTGVFPDGSYGRIGIPRDLFEKLGGYDEAMLPMGAQDGDLLTRVFRSGHKIIRLPAPADSAIQNTLEDKMREIPAAGASPRDYYKLMNRFNRSMSKLKLEFEGPYRLGGYSSYRGRLNGELVLVDGFNNVSKLTD